MHNRRSRMTATGMMAIWAGLMLGQGQQLQAEPGEAKEAAAETIQVVEEATERPQVDKAAFEQHRANEESAEPAPAAQVKGDPEKPAVEDVVVEEAADETLRGEVENASVTEKSITIDGQTIHYRATAANMPMKDDDGKTKATIFFVAYEKIAAPEEDETSAPHAETDHHAQPDHHRREGNGQAAPNEPGRASQAGDDGQASDDRNRQDRPRPITFVFNGGPGAAAVWLHLGTAGPMRIDLEESGESPGPPYRLVENSYSWLDATDLVFVDPVGTGYSRPAEGEKGTQFYGVKEDINWVSNFIRLYITEYQRWVSPIFLAGESYGTTRAAGLSEHLLDRYGIALNGIIFISTVLDFQTLQTSGGNDLPYWLYLPTYTACAWYHGRLGEELQSRDLNKLLSEVECWAVNSYTAILAKGVNLPDKQRQQTAERLARYTALPVDFILESNLRIDPSSFQTRLLSEQQQLIGRFDGRITGFNAEPLQTWPMYDPSLSHYLPVYSATFNDYARRTLGYKSILPYEVLSRRVRPWKYGEESGMGYLSVVETLRDAMIKNPHMRVLFASGHYDMATPYYATLYTIDHLNVGPELRGHIEKTFYSGGHMMYHNREDLEKLHQDIKAFIAESLP